MLRVNKVKDKKSENKRKKLKSSGASKEEISKVKDNFSDALNYFFEKEFTQNNIPDHKKDYKNYLGEGVWNGTLSKELGINRVVKASDFSDLYNSIHPDSKDKLAKNTKRGYIELVFNCPKDFSILNALDDNVRAVLNDIFDDAIEETMSMVDREFNYARVNNKNEKVKMEGMAYASFIHTTSRPTNDENSIIRPDPHLHSHNILWTTSKDKDDQFRAIEDMQIFKNQVYIGTYFRSIIAQKLIGLGYEIEPHTEVVTSEDDNGKEKQEKIKSFRIKQITNEQRLFFSKRKNDIEYLAKKYGMDNSICKDYIAQNYKNRKAKFDPGELLKIWKEDAEKLGMSQDFFKSLRTFNRSSILENIISDEDLIRKAVIKKDGKEQIYTTVLMRVLCEYSQYVPIDPHEKLKQLIDDNLIVKTGKFTFKKTFPDYSKKSFIEESFYLKRNATSKIDKQKFLGEYLFTHKSFLVMSEIEKKLKVDNSGGMQNIKIKNNETAEDLLRVKSYGNNEHCSSSAGITSFNASIESLYASIEELQRQARKKGLSQAEVIKLLAQIEKIRLQIEELEKQKKNQYKH